MKTIAYLLFLSLLGVTIACKTTIPKNKFEVSKTLKKNEVRQLCGTYVAHSDILFDSLTFSSWQEVEMMRTYIPASHYFITGDSVIIHPDKSFLIYKIVDDSTLIGGWVSSDTLHLVRDDQKNNCSTYKTLNATEQQQRRHLEGYFEASLMFFGDQKSEGQSILLKNCEEGHARSCMGYALSTISMKMDENDKIHIELDYSYLQKACDMGDYMGCFKLGEYMVRDSLTNEAKVLFAKGCELEHTASCMMIELLEMED